MGRTCMRLWLRPALFPFACFQLCCALALEPLQLLVTRNLACPLLYVLRLLRPLRLCSVQRRRQEGEGERGPHRHHLPCIRRGRRCCPAWRATRAGPAPRPLCHPARRQQQQRRCSGGGVAAQAAHGTVGGGARAVWSGIRRPACGHGGRQPKAAAARGFPTGEPSVGVQIHFCCLPADGLCCLASTNGRPGVPLPEPLVF